MIPLCVRQLRKAPKKRSIFMIALSFSPKQKLLVKRIPGTHMCGVDKRSLSLCSCSLGTVLTVKISSRLGRP